MGTVDTQGQGVSLVCVLRAVGLGTGKENHPEWLQASWARNSLAGPFTRRAGQLTPIGWLTFRRDQRIKLCPASHSEKFCAWDFHQKRLSEADKQEPAWKKENPDRLTKSPPKSFRGSLAMPNQLCPTGPTKPLPPAFRLSLLHAIRSKRGHHLESVLRFQHLVLKLSWVRASTAKSDFRSSHHPQMVSMRGGVAVLMPSDATPAPLRTRA